MYHHPVRPARVLAAVALVATVVAPTAATAESRFSGSYSKTFQDVPSVPVSVEQEVIEVCLGNPGDPWYHCEVHAVEFNDATPGVSTGTLTMHYNASRDGQSPSLTGDAPLPAGCVKNGHPQVGAEILLTTHSSVTKVSAVFTFDSANLPQPLEIKIPAQNVSRSGTTVPARVCLPWT